MSRQFHRSAIWRVWQLLPDRVRGPAHALIALARRARARSTPLPSGPPPPLPDVAIELPTRYGSFWFDSSDEKLTPWIQKHATWEADVLRFFSTVVRPGMTAADVGANVGFVTVFLSQLVGPAGHVHAFEPLPVTLDLLRANVWRHRCANTEIHPVAVSERAGTVTVAVDPEGRSGARLASSGELEVPAVTLDEALGATRVDVLKIDVEGAEPLVLQGARAILECSPGLTAVAEFRPERHLDGRLPAEVLELYEELGLRLHLMRPDGAAVPADRADVLRAAEGVATLNIVLTRGTRATRRIA